MNAVPSDRAKRLIAEALERPAAEREAFLRENCADPVLRAEIDAYVLDHHSAPTSADESESVTALASETPPADLPVRKPLRLPTDSPAQQVVRAQGHPVAMWPRIVVAVALIKVGIGLARYFSGQTVLDRPPPVPIAAYVVLAVTFGLLGLALVTANRHDVRATWLGSTFVLVSAPLVTPLMHHASVALAWLLFLRPDAFLPAFLWRFAREFPTPLTGRPSRVFGTFADTAAALGAVVAAVNLTFLIWPPVESAPEWRELLRPAAGAGRLYYPLVFGLCVIAFGALFWRARHAAAQDRPRLQVFIGGLIGGLVPFAVNAILEAIPAYNAAIHQPGVELAVGFVLFGALATVPFVTAYSVLFDRVVELRVVLRTAAQYGLARYTVIGAEAVPFGGLVLLLGSHRNEPIAALLSGPRAIVLVATSAIGFAALRLRQPLLDRLDRRFFREQYDARRTLDRLVADAWQASDARDLNDRICVAIDAALHADASLFVSSETPTLFRRPDGRGEPISATGILSTLAMANSTPMAVDPNDDRSPFRHLPPDEQRWLLSSRAHLLIGLRSGAGHPVGLLVLTAKRSGLPYSDQDNALLTAAATAASLALDNLRLRASYDGGTEPAARECEACHRLNSPDAVQCICGGSVVEARAPHLLRGVFQLDRRIGAGGMGVVYHARDLNLDRSVAIKTLPRVTPEAATRLRREARAMAAVVHPNLAVVHGVETWQGIPFLIEEFLPGGSLADRLRGGPLAVSEALDLAATLAGALDHLHQAGLIHRDLKPSNIGFTASGVVKLLDFGVARLIRTGAGPEESTRSPVMAADQDTESERAVEGTRYYMSPEALAGRRPTRAFDLWSLTVVLYESLTGRRPFRVRTAAELQTALEAQDFARPSTLAPQCGPDIDEFFSRAFSPDRGRRTPDATALKTELLQLRNVR